MIENYWKFQKEVPDPGELRPCFVPFKDNFITYYHSYQVVLDYKNQKFIGVNNGAELKGLMIEMNFEKLRGTWKLFGLEIKEIPYKVSLQIQDPLCTDTTLSQVNYYDMEMHTTTQHGYEVSAPAGLCFSCNQPGNIA